MTNETHTPYYALALTKERRIVIMGRAESREELEQQLHDKGATLSEHGATRITESTVEASISKKYGVADCFVVEGSNPHEVMKAFMKKWTKNDKYREKFQRALRGYALASSLRAELEVKYEGTQELIQMGVMGMHTNVDQDTDYRQAVKKEYYARRRYLLKAYYLKLAHNGDPVTLSGREGDEWEIQELSWYGDHYRQHSLMATEKDAVLRVRQLARIYKTKATITRQDTGNHLQILVHIDAEKKMRNMASFIITKVK